MTQKRKITTEMPITETKKLQHISTRTDRLKQKRRRKQKVKKNIPSKPIDLSVLRKKLSSMVHTVVGLDMSLSNPGICIVQPIQKKITLFYFRNRKLEHNGIKKITDEKSCFYNWFIEIICLEQHSDDELKELGSSEKCNQYMARISMIITSILSVSKSCNTLVGIEHYSYNSIMSNAYSTLMELGGCMRVALSSNFYRYEEISPTAIKKLFSGNGKAKKDTMYDAYQHKYHMPDMCEMIGLGGKTYKHVPHPVEDLVDAFAVALSTIVMTDVSSLATTSCTSFPPGLRTFLLSS